MASTRGSGLPCRGAGIMTCDPARRLPGVCRTGSEVRAVARPVFRQAKGCHWNRRNGGRCGYGTRGTGRHPHANPETDAIRAPGMAAGTSLVPSTLPCASPHELRAGARPRWAGALASMDARNGEWASSSNGAACIVIHAMTILEHQGCTRAAYRPKGPSRWWWESPQSLIRKTSGNSAEPGTVTPAWHEPASLCGEELVGATTMSTNHRRSRKTVGVQAAIEAVEMPHNPPRLPCGHARRCGLASSTGVLPVIAPPRAPMGHRSIVGRHAAAITFSPADPAN